MSTIALNQDWLPKHFERHEVEESMVSEMRTDIVCANGQVSVKAYVKDSRGKVYEKHIQSDA